MKKLIVVSLFIALLVLKDIPLVHALTYEQDLDPTSFKVKILPWEQVDSIIPKNSIFTIIDVETGLLFNVQRRAGNKHADVQPLTHEDTKIMKTIYNGKWSWNRRSILVLTSDRMLAGSMHGMPHGAGALQNGFPGHFCVHFLGSTTHRLKNEDFAHKIMILKAGGKLENYLAEIGPNEMVEVLEMAINQNDKKLMDHIVTHSNSSKFTNQFQNIQLISFDKKSFSLKEDFDNQMVIRINASADIYTRDHTREKKIFDFILWKDFGSGQWLFDNYVNFDKK